ncbi:hypothetical protein NECAME_16787 [Necator americanus]|uniref:Bestrophin homolog n=1 Tax=Necator americanus TaxID=51031 RepID=W2TWE1_NECAM|nr:hypothetical protein NECAME_16787 [Necator americanus]ETN85376.1 hypothetical protein NECAME_16787 [Necator americanus]
MNKEKQQQKLGRVMTNAGEKQADKQQRQSFALRKSLSLNSLNAQVKKAVEGKRTLISLMWLMAIFTSTWCTCMFSQGIVSWMPPSDIKIFVEAYSELTIFTTAFAIITTVYRTNHFLSEEQRRFWDNLSALFDQKLDYIPLTFMLGFFVTIIVSRWNEYFNNIGWVDNTALVMSTYLRGNDEKSRMMRRNVIRYMVLTQELLICTSVLKKTVFSSMGRRHPGTAFPEYATFTSGQQLGVLRRHQNYLSVE